MRRYFYPLLAAVFFVALAVPFFKKTDSQWDNVYVGAAERMLAGDDLFRLEDGYLYPPFMAWLAIPFTYLPPVTSRAVWYLINVAALIVLWGLAWRLSGGGSLAVAREKWKEHLILWLGLLAALRYAIDCLQNQQTDLVIAALLITGCLLLSKEKGLAAATLFGLAAGMKCTALLWCPYLLWRRQWLPAAWVGIVAIGVNLLPNLASTPASGNFWLTDWAERYLALLTRSDHAPGVWGSAIVLNQSWSGAAYRWFMTTWEWDGAGVSITERVNPLSTTTLKIVVYGASMLAVAGCAWLMGWNPRAKESGKAIAPGQAAWEFSVVLLLMVLLSPMSSKPHFATLLLPAWLLAREGVANRSLTAWVCLGAAILCGLLATKDITGASLATIVMWHGAVSGAAFALLVGCCGQLPRAPRGSVTIQGDTPVARQRAAA